MKYECKHQYVLVTNRESVKIWWALVFTKKQEQFLLCKKCGVCKR